MTDTTTTLHPALWLESQGAKFCRVTAHDAPGNSPGKRALGDSWQDYPLSWADVLPHVNGGGNVGMICGQHSGGLILVDVDENLPGFLEVLPHYADYPHIVRDNPDKAKFIIRLPDGVEWEGSKKYKRTPQDKHPFLELLCTGNQGVIPPSRHPSGEFYRLVNSDKPIPTVNPDMLALDVSLWVDVMRYPTPTEAHQPEPTERPRLHQENGGGLREAVRDTWTPLKVFEYFGMAANGTKQEHSWIRVLGNGGLFVHENGQTWALPSGGKGWGGDVFDAWHYAATHGESPKLPHERFYDVLCEMATAAGIPIPAHHTMNIPPPPNNFGAVLAEALPQALPDSENTATAPDSTETPDRFTLFWASDALEPQPPLDWVIEGLLTAGSLSAVVGDGGSKKTFSLLDMAVCVASGKERWLNFPVTQGPVLFVDEESGPRRLKKRLNECLTAHFCGPDTPIACVSLAGFDLRTPDDSATLHRMILQIGARLVIVDALVDVMPGGNENDTAEIQPLMLALRRVAYKTGAAIVLIHHTNKNGGYRGSTALKGAVDLMLTVESKPDSEFINFATEKARDIEPVTFSARANFAPGQFWLSEAENHKQQIFTKAEQYVLRYLVTNRPAPMPDIIGAADSCSESAATKAVYSLVSKGLVFRTNPNEKGRGTIAAYSLTDLGMAAFGLPPSRECEQIPARETFGA